MSDLIPTREVQIKARAGKKVESRLVPSACPILSVESDLKKLIKTMKIAAHRMRHIQAARHSIDPRPSPMIAEPLKFPAEASHGQALSSRGGRYRYASDREAIFVQKTGVRPLSPDRRA